MIIPRLLFKSYSWPSEICKIHIARGPRKRCRWQQRLAYAQRRFLLTTGVGGSKLLVLLKVRETIHADSSRFEIIRLLNSSGVIGRSHVRLRYMTAPSGLPITTATLRPSWCRPSSQSSCNLLRSGSTSALTGTLVRYLYSTHQSAKSPEYQTSAVPELNGLFIFSRCGSCFEGSSLCSEVMNWFSGLVDK